MVQVPTMVLQPKDRSEQVLRLKKWIEVASYLWKAPVTLLPINSFSPDLGPAPYPQPAICLSAQNLATK
jgi:hypothetical protein